MFESLDRTLAELASQDELWYHPNPGNAGDALIATATWQRFRHLGIRVRPVPRDGFSARGKVVLYGGGGNLVPMYRQASDFLESHHQGAKRLVLLPSTVDGHGKLLSALGPNCILFCREKVSYDHCRRWAPNARVELSHDLALGLEPGRLAQPSFPDWTTLLLRAMRVSRSRGRIEGAGLSEAWRLATASRALVPLATRSGHSLDAFRGDRESGRDSLPAGNLDLSEMLSLKDVSETAMRACAALLVRSLRGWKQVRTDRLHVCIAASLVGTSVEFHPNSYFKCAAIWEHSLRGRFPSIRWVEA